MSINYHAFQNRGVIFTDNEAARQEWWDMFAAYDPERIAKILDLKRTEEYLYVPYLGEEYRLKLENGHLARKEEETWTEKLYVNETMAVYHLLRYTKDHPMHAGEWVPGHVLDGVISRNTSLPDPLLTPFAQKYTGKAGELREASLQMAGEQLGKGDFAYQFKILPGIDLQMIFWDADEDFAAQVQILADRCITDYVHYETVGCLISDLFEKIEKRSCLDF